VLGVRGGATLAPELPGWRLAPLAGASALRQLIRARIVASKEAGRAETSDALLATAREHGIELAGYRLGARMVRDLESAELADDAKQIELALDTIPGSALWLRTEPGDDPAMAEGLAGLIAAEMAA
ncbi:MAG TPA: hypothetical protein VM055_08690, partial [Novosphingobium sp.]|nr:hypothetical protein [Novosphingobium sp.]